MATDAGWINETRKRCSQWAEIFALTSAEPKAVDAFFLENLGDWQLVVAEHFGKDAQRRLREVSDVALRAQIARGYVTIVDLSKTLEENRNMVKTAAENMLALQATLQRLARALNRLRSTMPPMSEDEAMKLASSTVKLASSTVKPEEKAPPLPAGSLPGGPLAGAKESKAPFKPAEKQEAKPVLGADLLEPTEEQEEAKRPRPQVLIEDETEHASDIIDTDTYRVRRLSLDSVQTEVPSDDDEGTGAFVVEPVNLATDHDWQEPVIRLTQRKGSSSGKIPMEDRRPHAEEDEEGELTLNGKDSPSSARIDAAAAQAEVLGRFETWLGLRLPRSTEALVQNLKQLDQSFCRGETKGEPSLPQEEKARLSDLLTGLVRQINTELAHTADQVAGETLMFQVTQPMTFRSPRELPAVHLAHKLKTDNVNTLHLPEELLHLDGAAVGFSFSASFKPSITPTCSLPVNRLELGFVAEPRQVLGLALHLLDPSSEAPLGSRAELSLPGSGVFHQIQLPMRLKPAHRKAMQRFVFSEVGRFIGFLTP